MVMHTLWIAEFLTVVLTLTKISVTAITASAYLIIVEFFIFPGQFSNDPYQMGTFFVISAHPYQPQM